MSWSPCIPHKQTAKTVAEAVVSHVFYWHSILDFVFTDRGCEFDNKAAIKCSRQRVGIDKKRISPIHAQENGTVERFNSTLGEMFRKSADNTGENWDLEIPHIR